MEKRNLRVAPSALESSKVAGGSKVGPSDSRRDKLLKWKNEKETTRVGKREAQKPPFKLAIAHPKNSISTKKNPQKPPVSEMEKRVTRSMKINANPLVVPMNHNVARGISAIKAKTEALNKINKLGLDKNKNKQPTPTQTIFGRGIRGDANKAAKTTKTLVVSFAPVLKSPMRISDAPVSQANTKASQPSHADAPEPTQTSESTQTSEENQVFIPIKMDTQPTPLLEIRKKTKGPKKFDEVYLRFTEAYMKAGRALMDRNTEWNNYLETQPEIPEIFKENIASAIGKSKLLYMSKLPQFIELLYFYLNGICDPGPILECDLQGWWDVVSIQLELMEKTFDDLTKLKENEWKENVPEPKIVKKLQAKLPAPAIPAPKPARANGGFLAFLEAKRNGGNVPATTVQEEIVVKSPRQKTLEKKNFPFSPAGSNTSFGSPSRRRSSIDTSLCMLAVRNSMGHISRIGAPKFSTDCEMKIDEAPTINSEHGEIEMNMEK